MNTILGFALVIASWGGFAHGKDATPAGKLPAAKGANLISTLPGLGAGHFSLPDEAIAAMRGINLAGWIVLQRQVTPSLFDKLADVNVTDEFYYVDALGEPAKAQLENHWKTFITKADFEYFKKNGLNTVKVSVSPATLNPKGPNTGSARYVDAALVWAEEVGLAVVLELQFTSTFEKHNNDAKPSLSSWGSEEQVKYTTDALAKMVHRWGQSHVVVAFGVLDTLDASHVELDTVLNFYKQAYSIVVTTGKRLFWNDAKLAFSSITKSLGKKKNKEAFHLAGFEIDDIYAHLNGADVLKYTCEAISDTLLYTVDLPFVINWDSLPQECTLTECLSGNTYEQIGPVRQAAVKTAMGAQLQLFERRKAGWIYRFYKSEKKDDVLSLTTLIERDELREILQGTAKGAKKYC